MTSAYFKMVGNECSCLSSWPAALQQTREGFFGHQELRRNLIADNLYPLRVILQVLNVCVVENVYSARVEEQVSEFMEQGEDLARLCATVV